MPNQFADRLNLAMEKLDIKTLSDLSARTGISRNSLSTWTTKGKIPGEASLRTIAYTLNVSVKWLRTGEGPMEPAYVLVPPVSFPFPERPTVGIPFLSSAWLHLDSIVETRGLKLSSEEHSRVMIRAAWTGMQAEREPTIKDVLDAISIVLGGE